MKNKLIELYCTICQCNDSRFREELQRQSSNNCPKFTDEELITVYLWGKRQQLLTRTAIYNYTKSHLFGWFPSLPSYQAFCRRLNRIAGAFRALSEIWLEAIQARSEDSHCYAVDSCPIMLARRSNSTGAKVGKPLCNKCYNATRKEWYHGVKLHAFVMLRPGKLPIPCAFQINQASLCDLWAAKQIDLDCAPIANGKLFADHAYTDADAAWKVALRNNRAIGLITPRKKKPTDILSSGDCFNSSVASSRQPVESFFNWLQIKSHYPILFLRSFFQVFSSLAFCMFLLLYDY